MFEKLNAIPWHALTHAYGSAEEVPQWLRQLMSLDPEVRSKAANNLGASICHQGWICPATGYTVPFLIELLREPNTLAKKEILGLLIDIAEADPLSEENWRDNARVQSWRVPKHIPFKDAYAEVYAGLSTYIDLVQDDKLPVRMMAVKILTHFPEAREDVRNIFLQELQRQITLPEQANLLISLRTISKPEDLSFFLDIMHSEKPELLKFAAALVVAPLAQKETPQEVVWFLKDIMLREPEPLPEYQNISEGRTAWSEARWALYRLGTQRLEALRPALFEAFSNVDVNRAECIAQLLFFIDFDISPYVNVEPPTHYKSKTFNDLTERQQKDLRLLFERKDMWEIIFDWNLRNSGLPTTWEQLASYLGYEILPTVPPQQEHQTPATKSLDTSTDDVTTNIRSLYNCIRKCYPEISLSPIGPRYGNGEIYEVNHRLLFHFPHSSQSREKMMQERALLLALQNRLPLPIANPIYWSDGSRSFDRPFMGYQKLPGKQLYKELLESVDTKETQHNIAIQLASFLTALHHISVADLKEVPLQEIDLQKRYTDLYDQVQATLFPYLETKVRHQVADHFRAYQEDSDHFTFIPALVHGHFGPHTILYDAKNRSLGGIINFSHAGLGDPALDFAELLAPTGYDHAFLKKVQDAYSTHTHPQFYERASFYAFAHILQQALESFEKYQDAVTRGYRAPSPEQIIEVLLIHLADTK